MLDIYLASLLLFIALIGAVKLVVNRHSYSDDDSAFHGIFAVFFGFCVAIVLGCLFHLIGDLFPAALAHFFPKMSLNLGEFAMFEPMIRGALTIIFVFISYIIMPTFVIWLVGSCIHKFLKRYEL